VQEFDLGDGHIGLHLSSYAISPDGSAQAAAGRDVFLVFDPQQQRLADGGIRLGVSKRRDRASGAWKARLHRFYLRDVDKDGRTDIGVLAEDTVCMRPGLPSVSAGAVRWHVLRGSGWTHDRNFDGVWPVSSRASELALVGLEKSPTAFVLEACAGATK
jgi:hypothetical protein